MLAEVPAVRGFLRRLATGRPDLDIEDLLQETMLRAWKYQSSFDPGREARAWLQSVAFRVFLDARERARRGPRPLGDQEVEADAASPGGAAPRTAVVDAEALERLLGALPERDRAVLHGFHVEGRSVRELATVHDVAEGTVKSWLHRARRRLAEGADPEAWL